jgi:hemerythrin
MIEKFKGLIGKAMRSVEDSISAVAVEINTFLSTWIIEHIIENDLPMKGVCGKNG